MRAGKLIVNLCPTGMVPSKADNPAVPISPEEIAADCVRCCAAGASIVHLHARDDDGSPSFRADIYREIITRIKRERPDVIVCVSTSGRHHRAFEQRSAVLDLDGDAMPDMASLTLGSMNFPKQASINEPEMIQRLADTMRERGIVPELEVFDLGMIDYAKHLIERKVLRAPFYFNILLGSLGTAAATPSNLTTMVSSLPSGAAWGAAGIGRFQLFVNAMAVVMGGHVRVGLEDNLYFDEEKTQPAANLGLVERICGVARAVERPIATPTEARAILGIARR
jgi:uncharacterized protein (DUF849 family)